MENEPIIFEYGLKAKRKENRKLRETNSTSVAEQRVKRVRFANVEGDDLRFDQGNESIWEQQSHGSDRVSEAGSNLTGSHLTFRSAPSATIIGRHRNGSDVVLNGALSARRRSNSRQTVPDGLFLRSSRLAEALDILPTEYVLGDLQHSLRTVPTSKVSV
mmetsp:Transcript_7453/g.8969  ORF Transcript_7453/g.8969 Transcript_7453/m.8969 type:complete len:160 (+) Transcript_7453:2-481(+)